MTIDRGALGDVLAFPGTGLMPLPTPSPPWLPGVSVPGTQALPPLDTFFTPGYHKLLWKKMDAEL
jgi:hypothetical protein